MKSLSELGYAIKKARWHKMIKQKDFAKKLGVNSSHISEIENGKKYPSIELLWKIEKIVGPVWTTPTIERRG